MKNIKKLRFGNFSILASILLISLYVIFTFSELNPIWRNQFFTSDSFYLSALFKDIFLDKYGLEGWTLNGAPNFFPDMLIYFTLYPLSFSPVITAFLYALVQNLLIVLGVFLIVKNLIQKLASQIAVFISLLFIIPLLSGTLSTHYEYSYHLMMNAYHTSSFTMTLFALSIWLMYLNSPKKILLVLLFILVTLSSLSDRIFIISFVIPNILVGLILLIRSQKKQKTYLIYFTTLLGTISGMGIFFLIDRYTEISFIAKGTALRLDKIALCSNALLSYFKSVFLKFDIISITLTLIVISYINSLVYFLKHFIKKERIASNYKLFIIITFFLFSIIAILLTPIFTGAFYNLNYLRYNIFFFYAGLILLGINIFIYINKPRCIIIVYYSFIITSAFLLIGLTIKKNPIASFKNNVSYKPKYIKIIDSLNNNNLLLNGVSGYWQARETTIFNDKNINVLAVNSNLSPNIGVTFNKFHYLNNSDGTPRYFNFVLSKKWKPNLDTSFIHRYWNNTILDTIDFMNFRIFITPLFQYDSSTFFIKPKTDTLFRSNLMILEGTLDKIDERIISHRSVLANGYNIDDILSFDYASSGLYFLWYNDSTVSAGNKSDFQSSRLNYIYQIDATKKYKDIQAFGVDGTNDLVYALYKDGTYSIGSSKNLISYATSKAFNLPKQYNINRINDIAICKSSNSLYLLLDKSKIIHTDLDNPQDIRAEVTISTSLQNRGYEIIAIGYKESNKKIITLLGRGN